MNTKPTFQAIAARTRREALVWAVTWAAICAAEILAKGGALAGLTLACALALGLALILGAFFGCLSATIEGAKSLRGLVSLVLGGVCCSSFLAASDLLPVLQSPPRRRALAVALGALTGATLVAAAVWSYWHFARPGRLTATRARRTAGALFLITAAAGLVADAIVPYDIHSAVHAALQAGALVAAALAASSLWQRSLPPRLERGLLALGAAIGAAPWLVPWTPAAAHASLAARAPAMLLRLARHATDWDGDGYSSQFAHGDCAPFRSDITPGKRDIPGNGIDENCLDGDRTGVATSPEPTTAPAASAKAFGVVLVTVDSLRADRAPPRPGAAETMPALSSWARDALRFENAYAAGGSTVVSLPALFRGTYPRRLAWTRIDQVSGAVMAAVAVRTPGAVPRRTFALSLTDPRPSLQQLLHESGIHTGAVVDDGGTRILGARLGGFAGFDQYVEVSRLKLPPDGRDDAATTDAAIAALESLSAERFFLWVHYFGPHTPTTWHAEVPRADGVTGAYDHEVRFADRQLGRLLTNLSERRQRGQRLAVIVTADHGEDLTTFERHHGMVLDDGVVRVPLLLSLPDDRTGQTISAPVSLVDIMPTVLGELGVPAPRELDGVDLRVSASSKPPAGRVVISETWRFDHEGRRTVDQLAAISSRTREVFDVLDQDWVSGDAGMGAPAERRSLEVYLEQVGGPVIDDVNAEQKH